jgi:hypothetical protein
MRTTRDAERRRCPRFPVTVQGTLFTEGARFDLMVSDLSMHGVFCTPCTAATLLPGAAARLVLIDGGGYRCEMNATATAHRGVHAIGLAWRGNTAYAQKQLRRLIWANVGGDARERAACTPSACNIRYLAPARHGGPRAPA